MKKLILLIIFIYPFFVYAQDADFKSWSGSSCDPYYGTQANKLNKTLNGIKNISNSPVWVTCSPTREYLHGILNVRLSVKINQDYPDYTTCLFTTRNADGEIYTSGYAKTRLDSGWMDLDITAGDSMAARVLACKLPSATTLSYYFIFESDG